MAIVRLTLTLTSTLTPPPPPPPPLNPNPATQSHEHVHSFNTRHGHHDILGEGDQSGALSDESPRGTQGASGPHAHKKRELRGGEGITMSGDSLSNMQQSLTMSMGVANHMEESGGSLSRTSYS